MKNLITTFLFSIVACVYAHANIYIVESTKSNFGECTGTININATQNVDVFNIDAIHL